MNAWERWCVACLVALSVGDVEDIYLFETIITGLLLIGLGIALVYQGIKKTKQSQSYLFSAALNQHWPWPRLL